MKFERIAKGTLFPRRLSVIGSVVMRKVPLDGVIITDDTLLNGSIYISFRTMRHLVSDQAWTTENTDEWIQSEELLP